MSKIIIPSAVPLALAQIEQEHRKTRAPRISDDEVDSQLEELVRLIVSSTPKVALKTAETLEKKQIIDISSYLSYYRLKEPMDNLFIVIPKMASKDEWKIVYTNWLNRFDREPISSRIREFITDSIEKHPCFHDFLMEENISISSLDWLNYKDPLTVLSKECAKYASMGLYEEQLALHGAKKGSHLFQECVRILLLVCDWNYYKTKPAICLADAFVEFSEAERKKFCSNFYDEVPIEKLIYEKDFLCAMDVSFNNLTMQRILSANGYKKYRLWKDNIELIYKNMDPERQEFWLPYAVKYKVSQFMHTIVIDFNKCVAVEFKGKAAGPMYLYTHEIYDAAAKPRMRQLSKTEFQSWELKAYEEDNGALERMPHTGPWQMNFRSKLKGYGIAPEYKRQ